MESRTEGSAERSSAKVAHPVYPVAESAERIETLREAVARMMAMSEDELVALVSDRTGCRFLKCPNCDEGAHEGQLVWTVEDPDGVTCKFCGMRFPNETHPEDQVLRVKNPLGEEVEYPYWEDDAGYRYFFCTRIWNDSRQYLASGGKDLGELYQLTGDRQYARRAALLLDTFARHYPGFLAVYDEVHLPKAFHSEPPFPRRGGKWGDWRYDEIPTNLVLAYDWIYASGELERLSDEAGADVRARIENDFFLGAVRQDDYHGPLYTNASPGTYQAYVVLGRVLGNPAFVHEAVRRSLGLFEREYFFDGFWSQGSVDYHMATLRGMQRVFDAVRGYSDPQGYEDPVDGSRFQDLVMERDLAIARRAMQVPELCRYPDGRGMTVHDSWGRIRESGAPDRSESVLLPGMGHAWLGTGEGSDQVQAHLHFSDGAYGHSHMDMLNLILFAKGQELLPDLGYTWTTYKQWGSSTLAHNTVLIDEKEQFRGARERYAEGDVLAFETGLEGVKWVEASGTRVYPDLASVYRRMVMLVETGGGDTYVVDLFRVTGGEQHDWALHGSADRDVEARTDVATGPYGAHMLPGVEVRPPEHARVPGDAGGRNPHYGFFQNVARGEVADGVTVTFDDPASHVGVRTYLPGMTGAECFLGDAPSIRRAQENDAALDRFRMPIWLIRRKGAAPLSSCFAAVHEPYDGEPSIEGVRKLEADGPEDAVVLAIEHQGFTDYVAHQTDPGNKPIAAGEMHFVGEAAFVRVREGVPEIMALWGGTELRWGGLGLRVDGSYEGEVSRSLRKDGGDPFDGLVIGGPVPKGKNLAGSTAIVTFGDGSTVGYPVTEVRDLGGDMGLVLTDDPGIVVYATGMRHLFCPRREIPGPVRYRIRTSALARLDPTTGEMEVTSVGSARLVQASG